MKLQARSNDKKNLELNFQRIVDYVRRYAPGTIFDIEVIRRVKENKGPLRKYYYSTVLPHFLEAYCYDPDEAETVHKHLKILFFHIQPDDHGIYRDKDVPALFADGSDKDNRTKIRFIEWVCRKSAEAGVRTPEPGERWKAA